MIKESATRETRWVVVIALQRPLYLDEHSGIVGSKRIESILQEIIHQMVRVQVVVHGDPVRYETYLFGVDPPYGYGRLFLKCAGWAEASKSLKFGSSLEVSFIHKGRAFYFDSQIIEIEGESLRISFPKSLLYYPQRGAPRTQHPLKLPVTVEFLDPWTHREKLVRELEDLGYYGFSFRALPQDRRFIPGMLLPRLELCAFDRSFYTTSVKVAHVTPCYNFQKEEYRRVGVVFQKGDQQLSQGFFLLKDNEYEEFLNPSEIQKCLIGLAKSKVQVQIQDEAQQRPAVNVTPKVLSNPEESLFLFSIRQRNTSRIHFAMGQPVRVQYVMYGTLYLFLTSVCKAAMDGVIVRIPNRIIQIQRRKALRSFKPVDQTIRLLFRTSLFNSKIVRSILDLSEKGLSISIDCRQYFLFPGMRIENAELDLNSGRYPLPCARVHYVKRIPMKRGRPICRIGIRFNHLPEITRRAISKTLIHKHHPSLVPSSDRMIPKIWDLYYQSGFIYPEKQASIKKIQKEIDRTWERLYSTETTFFLNLIFLEKENVLGSGSILQVYEESWLLQHLSALKRPLLPVSKEVNLGLAEELMRDKGIHYIKTYFQPNNPWPNKNFRAFAEQRLRPRDYDLTLYHIYQRDPSPIPVSGDLPVGVEIGGVQNGDSEIIKNYFIQSGKILSARSESFFGSGLSLQETSRLYRKKGLRRQRRIFVARRGAKILCFAVAEDASFGVNLSGLLNTFRIYLVNNEKDLLDQVLPFLINKVLDFYRSLGYTEVTLMNSELHEDLFKRWGFSWIRDYYCLTFHRQSILQYLHYIREKYGRLECRMLRRVK